MQALFALAAAHCGVPVTPLRAHEGRIGRGNNARGGKTYGDLLGGQQW